MYFIKLSFLIQILNLFHEFTSFAFRTDVPKYKTIGMWNLKGTSCLKYQDKNINLQVVPKTNCKNLKINWIKQENFGPLILKDNLEGTICCNKIINKNFDKKMKYIYEYNFKPKKYFISLTNIIGINIPLFINFEKNLEERFNVNNIKWELQNDLLFIEINEEHFIFSRSQHTNIQAIRLDHFIVSQILGYLLFKLIDKLHLL